MSDIHELALYRIARWFAAVVLLLLAGKVYLRAAWADLAPPWSTFPGHQLLTAVAVPHAFPMWQIAIAINAVLAWLLYIAADWVLARQKRGSRIDQRIIDLALRWLSLIRGALSVYTIVCLIYLAASLSDRFDLPPMRTGMLPWR